MCVCVHRTMLRESEQQEESTNMWFQNDVFANDVWAQHISHFFQPHEFIRLGVLSTKFLADVKSKNEKEGLCYAVVQRCYECGLTNPFHRELHCNVECGQDRTVIHKMRGDDCYGANYPVYSNRIVNDTNYYCTVTHATVDSVLLSKRTCDISVYNSRCSHHLRFHHEFRLKTEMNGRIFYWGRHLTTKQVYDMMYEKHIKHL